MKSEREPLHIEIDLIEAIEETRRENTLPQIIESSMESKSYYYGLLLAGTILAKYSGLNSYLIQFFN